MEQMTTPLNNRLRTMFATVAQTIPGSLRRFATEMRSSFTWYSAVATAGVIVIAAIGTMQITHKIQDTQLVYQVYVKGNYEGVIPGDPKIVQRLSDFALSFDIPVVMQPVHEAVHSTSESSINELLRRIAKLDVKAVAIKVDGRTIGTVASQQAAEQIMADLKEKVAPPQANVLSQSISFKDKVAFVPVDVSSSSLDSTQDVLRYLLTGGKKPETYTVSRGDTLWSIASAQDVSVDRLKAANPQLEDINSLKEGETLTLTKPTPLLSYMVTTVVKRNESIPFKTTYVDDNSLGEGTTQVEKPGVDGINAQVVKLMSLNGQVISEQIQQQSVVKEPVDAVVKRGTNSGVASGTYIWPTTSYVITSPYGEWRGNESHPGVDIGAPYGAPIYASNNGTVIEAGWDTGGYGNCVRIDHGNGVVSIYGHMSQVNVSVGQVVSQGTVIGHVGATGEATGPHLHYEIHVNGVRVNPAPYM